MGKTQIIGHQAEKIAESYLQKQGLITIERNFRCRLGEIDLIMQDREILSFIEVRYRRSADFGHALESVNFFKQKKCLRAAQYYLQIKQWTKKIAYRFDILALSGVLNSPKIEWVKNITMA